MTNSTSWSSCVATDPVEVHGLLRVSDQHHSQDSGSPVPERSFATTRRRVREGAVHVVRVDGCLAGMVTLTWDAPFPLEDGPVFPPAAKPAYISRLAVAPEWLGEMVGLRCLRMAIEAARVADADALRSEANPDLTATRHLLRLLGFEQLGQVMEVDGVRRIRLHRPLP